MICVRDFVGNLSWTLLQTFPVHRNELNSIGATQTGLSRTCCRLCRKHLDMLRRKGGEWECFYAFFLHLPCKIALANYQHTCFMQTDGRALYLLVVVFSAQNCVTL